MDEAIAVPGIPRVASLLADPARAAMLWTLIDGTSRPAGELAFAANVSAQSASMHLAKLVEGGLLLSQAHGRHRYFRIASADAASLIESLAVFGNTQRDQSQRQPPQTTLARTMPSQFLHARTCYDHLAGEVAVNIVDAMLRQGWLVVSGKDFKVTPQGAEKLATLGIVPEQAGSKRRIYARCCIDLTQRRPHLAGVLGAALLDLFVREAWMIRTARSRMVSMTPKGRQAMWEHFGVAV